eukprot:363395-Chlamydomonas_euryale.AAC.2
MDSRGHSLRGNPNNSRSSLHQSQCRPSSSPSTLALSSESGAVQGTLSDAFQGNCAPPTPTSRLFSHSLTRPSQRAAQSRATVHPPPPLLASFPQPPLAYPRERRSAGHPCDQRSDLSVLRSRFPGVDFSPMGSVEAAAQLADLTDDLREPVHAVQVKGRGRL